MKLDQFFQSLLLTGAVIVFMSTPARSEEVREDAQCESSTATTGKSRSNDTVAVTDKAFVTSKSPTLTSSNRKPRNFQSQIASSLQKAKSDKPSKKILQLSEIEQISQSAELLVQSPAPSSEVIQITGVQANPTDKGVEVILQTTKGEQLQPVNRSVGNRFIADIPNAQLRLSSGDTFTFRSDKPIAGVAEITVTNFDASTIRVVITGEGGVPTIELLDSPKEGLIFSVASGTSSTPPQQQPQTQQTSESSQPTSQTQPEQPSAQGDEPIELVVTGQQDTYRATNSSTGTRTNTAIRDIPQSIQVIPQQVLKDRQVIRVTDALENVSGVSNGGEYQGYEDYILIRGFVAETQAAGNYFKDGIRYFNFGSPETANLERIEVLKGPASILFGQAQPGGIINLVSKQPLSSPFYSLEGTVGSFDTYRGSFDISGPVSEDKAVLYRVNGLYDNSGSFRDFVKGERYFISPALSWAIGPNTSLKIEAEFLDDSRTLDDGIPALGRGIANIPRERFLGEPFNYYQKTDYTIGYVLDHRFNDNWSVRNAFRTQWGNAERSYVGSSELNETTGDLSRTAYYLDNKYNLYSTQTDVIGKFATGSIQHQILAGFEYTYFNNKRDSTNSSYPSINIFNPGYTNQPFSKSPDFFFDDTGKTLGVYVQDQIALSPNFKLVVGGRYDSFTNDYNDRNLSGYSFSTEDKIGAFSPRVGIIYQPSDAISLYASYTSSFKPQYSGARSIEGEIFNPETGSQYEVGIKGDFLDGKLSATLAAFDIKKQNVLTVNPIDRNFYVITGEQTSRGIELDVTGEILPGWNIIASYAYLDAFVSEDNTTPVGNRLFNVAENSASLWTTYEIKKGNLAGLGFGLGLFYVGDRVGDTNNTYVIPSYLRTDAAVYYRRNNWRAALNIKNLFDIDYFTGSAYGFRGSNQPGAPLTIIGSFALEL